MIIFSISFQEGGSQLTSNFVLLCAFLKVNFVFLTLEITLLKKNLVHYCFLYPTTMGQDIF